MTKEKHMGNVNDNAVKVSRIGHDEPPQVAVIFTGRRVGYDLSGTIPDCRYKLIEALRQLTHIEVRHNVDTYQAELEAEGDQ